MLKGHLGHSPSLQIPEDRCGIGLLLISANFFSTYQRIKKAPITISHNFPQTTKDLYLEMVAFDKWILSVCSRRIIAMHCFPTSYKDLNQSFMINLI